MFSFKEMLDSELELNRTVPKLTDDDYFVDKSDSLVYTYLLNENVKNNY